MIGLSFTSAKLKSRSYSLLELEGEVFEHLVVAVEGLRRLHLEAARHLVDAGVELPREGSLDRPSGAPRYHETDQGVREAAASAPPAFLLSLTCG